MSNDGWYQLKHNWVTLLITVSTSILGYTAYKIDTYVTSYDNRTSKLEEKELVNRIVDSIQSSNDAWFKYELQSLKEDNTANKNEIQMIKMLMNGRYPIAAKQKTVNTNLTIN